MITRARRGSLGATAFACLTALALVGCGELDRAQQEAYEVGRSVDDPVRRAEGAAEQSAESIEQLHGELEDIQP